MIVSGFRAALDLNTYPLSNLIRPRCAERAKPGRGKPVLIMRIGVFACFHAVSLERRSFQQNRQDIFYALVYSTETVGIAHKPPRIPLVSRSHTLTFERRVYGVATRD